MLDAPSVGLLDEFHPLSSVGIFKLEFWRNALTTHHAFVNSGLLVVLNSRDDPVLFQKVCMTLTREVLLFGTLNTEFSDAYQIT
jgi:hypothetical protein